MGTEYLYKYWYLFRVCWDSAIPVRPTPYPHTEHCELRREPVMT